MDFIPDILTYVFGLASIFRNNRIIRKRRGIISTVYPQPTPQTPAFPCSSASLTMSKAM